MTAVDNPEKTGVNVTIINFINAYKINKNLREFFIRSRTKENQSEQYRQYSNYEGKRLFRD
jgi:hypothetical protein